jgi:signal transduction histidine kinase
LLVLHRVTRQKKAEAALLTQKQLFQNLVAVARATTERPTLEATLQNALDVAVKLTRAELGSLFALDDNNTVTHSILSRGETTHLEQQVLVGRVMDQGLAGWVFRHKEPALIHDTLFDERWITFSDAPYVARSVLAVPILSGETVLGTLTLQHAATNHFVLEDLKLMQAAADHMTLALRNAQIYENQRRLAQQQSALYETLRTVGGHLEPDTVINAAASTVASVTGWTAVAILAPGDDKDYLVVEAASGILSPAEGRRIPIGKSICGQVFTEGNTCYVPDVSRSTNYVAGHETIKSELAVPIQRAGRMLGVLDVESDQLDCFSQDDIRLAESLAETIGLALDHAQLFRVIEDERSRLQALIQSSRDGVILVGIDQRILVMNQPAHELLKLPGKPVDWVNRSVMEALAELFEYAPLAAQATMAGVRYMNQGIDPPSEGEIQVEPRTLRWINSPVKVGNTPIGRLLSLHDITEMRQVEQAREDLTHTMVHDLRNPLNNIYGAQELIEELGPLNEDQLQVLDVAKEGSMRMLELVRAILDISRLESGHMPLDLNSLEIKPLVERMLESQRPLAISKDIRLEYKIPTNLSPANADRSLIERVLQNLVGNSLKFTPLGGTVLITAGEDVHQKNQIFIRVQDTGPGIPKPIQDRIFQKFTTGKTAGSGSGLGLTFCKMVVEAHEGRIWARSWPEQGATFTFTLPVALAVNKKLASQSEVSLFKSYYRPKR